jgi:uncharacterized protein
MTETLTIVTDFYALLGKGGTDAALAILDSAIEWTEAERSPYFCGTMRDVEAVVAGLFAPLNRDFGEFRPLGFVAQDDRIVTFREYSAVVRSSGRRMSAPFVHSWTTSNGRLQRFAQYTDSEIWNEALDNHPCS